MRRIDGIAIEIDTAACAGSGECGFRAPRTFRLGDDGKASVADPEGDAADAVLLAARTCPSFAIALRRDGKRLA